MTEEASLKITKLRALIEIQEKRLRTLEAEKAHAPASRTEEFNKEIKIVIDDIRCMDAEVLGLRGD